MSLKNVQTAFRSPWYTAKSLRYPLSAELTCSTMAAWHVQASVTAQPKAKTQVHVLEVAEVLLVEATDLVEGLPPVQRGGRTGREHLGVCAGPVGTGMPWPFRHARPDT